MKIGVLTYHCQPNFGAQLQAISTVGFLKRLGHDVVVLNWYAKDLEEMYSRRIPEEQRAYHAAFTSNSMPLSNKCQAEDELIAEIDRLCLDGIIAGSDALFKYIPNRNRRHFSIRRLKYIYHFTPISCERLVGNPFFGAFLTKLKHPIPAAVYAVSSQNCPYKRLTLSETRAMSQAMKQYRTISVRDAWTKKMVETVTGRKNIKIYPDPVFSFNQNCFLKIPTKAEILAKYSLSENYVLLSFSDWHNSESYIQQIGKEVEIQGFHPVALPMPEKLYAAGITKQISLPLHPLDWYALILYSKGYIGERMHPIVVCLHNAIPFFCFDEYGIMEKASLFSKRMKYNPNSSKTNLIVSDAGLQDNLYSYKSSTMMPTAHDVVEKLITFDKNRCKTFAERKQQEYEIGMKNIVESLF